MSVFEPFPPLMGRSRASPWPPKLKVLFFLFLSLTCVLIFPKHRRQLEARHIKYGITAGTGLSHEVRAASAH